jgi:UDP-N-acetylmuramoyl-L-alanyl-D-glutamate--2,6-diaminopimelate ligase
VTLAGITADIVTPQGIFAISSQLVGLFNLSNILAAVAAATFFEISQEAVRQGIAQMRGVPGRMERIENSRGVLVFVDYAHTGDALGQVLGMLKKTGARRIITVFGCGGDRDRSKRPVMGSVAAQHSAVVILTSDNPRSEDPDRIISEIEAGVCREACTRIAADAAVPDQETCYLVQPDRRAAIRTGIGLARPGDVVLIAGKGHETYQQIGTEKKHFDDREEARQALAPCA